MAAVSDEKFFMSIINQLDGSVSSAPAVGARSYAHNPQIDWQKVADECNIVTKGAA